MTTRTAASGAAALAVLGAVSFAVKHVNQEAAVLLNETRNVVTARAAMRDLASGSAAEKLAVGAFCTEVTKVAQGQAADGSDFFDGAIGRESTGYVEGKAEQVRAAWNLAQYNPQAAQRYAKACVRL